MNNWWTWIDAGINNSWIVFYNFKHFEDCDFRASVEYCFKMIGEEKQRVLPAAERDLDSVPGSPGSGTTTWWVYSGWAGTRPPRPSQSSRRLWSQSAQTPVQLQHNNKKTLTLSVGLVMTRRWRQSQAAVHDIWFPKFVESSSIKEPFWFENRNKIESEKNLCD